MHEDAGDPPTQPTEGQTAPETQAQPPAEARGDRAPGGGDADRAKADREADGGAGRSGGAAGGADGSDATAGASDNGPATDGASSDGGDEAAPRKRRRRRRRRRAKPEGNEGEPSSGAAEGADSSSGATSSDGVHAESGEATADAAAQPSTKAESRTKASDGRQPGQKKATKKKAKRKKRAPKEGRPAGRERAGRGPADRGHADRHSGRGSRTHAAAAIRELAAMTKDLLDAEDVPFLARPRHLILELRVPLDLERDGSKAAEQVVTQLLRRVQEVRAHESALKPGSVYCYFHESAESGTSRPNTVREVFDGYGSTGRPVFTDFVTMAVERRDEDLQRMLDGEDLILTHVSMGHILRTEQLAAFGKQSPIYRVLGQVDAGLYTLTGSDKQAAFSFQLLRGRTLDGAPRFRLHWVSGADLRDVADPNLSLVLGRFQQSLDQASLRYQGLESNGEAPDEEEFVRPFLVDLAKRLKGRAKRGNRRTGHATERADSSQRPTSKAFEDAKNAGDDSVLRDDEQGTIVIAGPKNRLHVFTPEAKHVTSFVMNGHNLQMRKREGRWLPSEPEDRGEFRIALRSRLESGDTEVSEDKSSD